MIILNNTATKVASLSAAADFLDADKHLNLKKAQAAGTKIAAAAERFAKAHAKGDAVATAFAMGGQVNQQRGVARSGQKPRPRQHSVH